MAASKGNKYRSGLEERFHKAVPNSMFEPFKVPYIINKDYIPDFVIELDKRPDIMVECKGFFRVGDTQKYKAIRDCTKGQYELVFVFSNDTKKLRKGSKMTLGEWCTKENMRFYTMETLDDFREYIS